MTRTLMTASTPTVAVEIARQRVSAATIVAREKGLAVSAHAVEPLPAGVVTPSLNAPNISDRSSVVQALRSVFERIGQRPRRIALAVPDSVAKVSLLKFEKVPEREHDLTELVKWQIRKAAPFRIDDAQLSYVPAMRGTDGSTEFVVVMARNDIIREYEGVCADAGAQAGIVDLATFNVINAILAGDDVPTGDWLLVHVSREDATMAIMRGEHLVFFRNRAADGEVSLTDMVHQTAMYYEDRLSGAGFSRVLLGGTGSSTSGSTEGEYIRRALEQRLSARVDHVDPRRAASLTDRINAQGDLLDALAPLVGLLARDRERAA